MLSYCHYHTDVIELTLLSNLSIGVFELGGAQSRKFPSGDLCPSPRAFINMFELAFFLVLKHPSVLDWNCLDPLMKDILLSGKDLLLSGGGVITMGQTTNSNRGLGKKLIELASFVVAADNWGYYATLPSTKKNSFVEDDSHCQAIHHNKTRFLAYIMNFENNLFEEDLHLMVYHGNLCNMALSTSQMCGKL